MANLPAASQLTLPTSFFHYLLFHSSPSLSSSPSFFFPISTPLLSPRCADLSATASPSFTSSAGLPPRILRSSSLHFFKSLLQRFPPKKAKPNHTILNRIPVNLTFRIFHLTYCIFTLCLFFSVSSLCCRLSLIVWCIPLCIECAWCLAGTLIRVCLWTYWQDSLQILYFSPCVLYLRRMIYMIEF